MQHEYGSIDDVSVAIWRALWRTQTIDSKRSKVCNNHIDKLVYAPRGHFMKVENIII
jgi:hypothetical protein